MAMRYILFNLFSYRNPRQYFEIFDKVENLEPDGKYSHFELVSCKCVDTYIRVKQNGNQICWKWKKVSFDQYLPSLSCLVFSQEPNLTSRSIAGQNLKTCPHSSVLAQLGNTKSQNFAYSEFEI